MMTKHRTFRKCASGSPLTAAENATDPSSGARDYAIFTSDADQRVTSWNLGAEAITGYAASEIVGQLRLGTEDGRGILPSSVLTSNFH
jgi:PAS domain-containing protein